ncbi:hypothetical protein D3C77_722750 [compost metagenome]
MPATEQANVQGEIHPRAKALTLLHQLRQKLLNLVTAHQRMADPAEHVRDVGLDGCQQVTALDHRIALRQQAIGWTRR